MQAQEAWFLFDEAAIRTAAGRPSGSEDLKLPKVGSTEDKADPKAILHAAVRIAAAKTGRRRRAMSVGAACHRVSELITDYSPLRALSSFSQLEADLQSVLHEL